MNNWIDEHANLKCGCHIAIYDGGTKVEFCPKHAAAPDMFEALTSLVSSIILNIAVQPDVGGLSDAINQAHAAIELAGGSESEIDMGQVEANDLEWNDPGIIRR